MKRSFKEICTNDQSVKTVRILEYKRRKLITTDKVSNSKDREELKQLCIILNECTLIQNCGFSNDLVNVLGQFSLGEWVKCCINNCNELNSFLFQHKDEKEQFVSCIRCDTSLWYHFCDKHRTSCTIIQDNRPRCYVCEQNLCYEHTILCVGCFQWSCGECESNRQCKICTHFGKQGITHSL